MKRFCPKCGKDVDSENMINNFCIDCYLEDNELMTAPLFEITICPRCGILKYARRFFKKKEELEKELVRHIKTHDLQQAKTKVDLHIDLENKEYYVLAQTKALIGQSVKTISKKFPISLRRDICETCSRVAGSYYTTILQLRFDTKKVKDELLDKIMNIVKIKMEEINQLKKNVAKQIHITKEKTQKTGIDLYINNFDHAQSVLRQLMSHKKAYNNQFSKTLVGAEKNGERRFRYTLCVHFKE